MDVVASNVSSLIEPSGVFRPSSNDSDVLDPPVDSSELGRVDFAEGTELVGRARY